MCIDQDKFFYFGYFLSPNSFISRSNNNDMSVQENIEIVRRAFEAFNSGDTSKVHEFISDEYINRES